MAGCIERAHDDPTTPMGEETLSRLQVDFDSEVNSHLFRVRGDLALLGNRSLPYLLLNATLMEGGRALQSTKYLMIDLQPGSDHGFEIAKSMRIDPGDYACVLEISGPLGTLFRDTRRCQANEPWIEPSSAMISRLLREQPAGIDESYFQQEEAVEEAAGNREAQEDETSPSWKGSNSRSRDQIIENVSPTRSGGYADPPRIRPAEREAGAEQDAEFVGSSSSKKYHLPECRYAQKIKADRKIVFASREEAEGQGYLPCKVCNP